MRNQLVTRTCERVLRRGGWIAVAVAALVGTVPACYTILKHPTVIQEDYTQAETQRCSDCHYESDLWHFNHPRMPYHPGLGHSDPWVYYYQVPWWYESFWFYGDTNDPETVPLHERTLRPEGVKDPSSSTRGDYITAPPTQKTGDSTIKTKIETKDDKNDDADSTKDDQKRSVRPSKKKKKQDN